MHRKAFGGRNPPDPLGSLQRSPNPLTRLKGGTTRAGNGYRERKANVRKGERKERGKEKKDGRINHLLRNPEDADGL